MRLICPRCGAQYEIPEAVIPAGGREVECSACGQVWHQPGPGVPGQGGEIAAKSRDTAQVAAPEPEPGLAGPGRPVLSRKLDDEVLAILREEAERELSARARESRRQPGADQNPVKAAAEAPPQPPAGAGGTGPAEFEWPVATVILPGEPLRDPDAAAPQPVAEATPAAQPEPQPAEQARPAEPQPAQPLGAARPPAGPDPAAPDPAAPQPAAAEPAARPARPTEAAPLLPVEEPVASITDPEPELGTAGPDQPASKAQEPETPPAPRLPDAARLAATLTRALPQAAPQPLADPAPAPAALPARPEPARSHPVPALRRQGGFGGYAAGFGLAVMLALALLGFYALAPRIEAGSQPGAEARGGIAEWRQGLDSARLWLHDSLARIAGR